MTRYYLSELSIEGFRGINNAGDPLRIKLAPSAVNSISAPNGVGKTSVFEAIHYAIFGEVPRLAGLQAAEQPETYINNRFHPGGASIAMTFTADDGTPDIQITVQRSAAGIRAATSTTGHADPEGFLRSLREDFVLVDYRKFARFIDDTALIRGRSFASLVGLSRYSTLRRALEGAKHPQSLNADFEVRVVETEIRTGEREFSDQARLALGAYTDVTSQTAADLADIPALCAAVTDALRGIDLLKGSLGTADIMAADLDELYKVVEVAEGGPLRQQHAALSAQVANLRELAPGFDEAAERTSLVRTATERDDALLKAGSSLLRELYRSASAVVADESWSDPFLCPVCDTKTEHLLDTHIAAKLAAYGHADQLNAQLGGSIAGAASIARLGKLEAFTPLAVTAAERRHATITADAAKNTLTTTSLQEAFVALDDYEAKRVSLLDQAEKALASIEKQLPPSLVAVTRVLDGAKRFRDAITNHGTTTNTLTNNRRRLKVRQDWRTFIGKVADAFAGAEAALAAKRISDIESEYQDFFKDLVRGGPNVQPTLTRAQDTEQVELLLADFHGLKGVSARALLSESYRNAVAASIFLAAARTQKGVPRFMILDDITSSFDAGHQFSLMEGIRCKLQQPTNPDGLQFIILSHDVALEKYFDTLNGTLDWRHQKLQGMPPVGRVMISAQEADRLKADALGHLNAGQIDIGAPLVRQYLEYKLGQIISRLEVPVPPDYATRGDRRTLSTYLSAIIGAVHLFHKAGICVLTSQQITDLSTRHGLAIMSNFVSHYETNAGAPFNAYALIGVVQSIDDLANCFTYQDTTRTPAVTKFYQRLDRR
ncbi:MAG: AAA family ATPase [Rhodocyclaceae bacterium]|nr:AAA family ATPase [Rhodocyclaceae bacterium]